MENEKMKEMARKIDKVSNVFQKLAFAGMIVCTVFMVLLLVFKDKIVTDVNVINIGYVSFTLTEQFVPDFAQVQSGIFFTLASGFAACFIVRYGIMTFRKILAPMKEGLPFDQDVPSHIRELGWTVIIGGIIIQALEIVSAKSMLSEYNLSQIVQSSAVSGITFNFSIDLTVVLVGIVLFALSYVFQYGALLQKESDETL